MSYFRLNSLFNRLNKYDKIFLYGTGNYAKEIYSKLCKINWKDRIAGFIISGEPTEKIIDSIPVFSIDAIDVFEKNSVILISVSSAYTEEIKEILVKKGFDYFFSLTEYEMNLESSSDLLTKISYEDYCEYIAEWDLYNNFESFNSYSDILNEINYKRNLYLNSLHDKAKKNKKQIVFVTGVIYLRITKFVLALIKKGYNIKIIQLDTLGTFVGESELISSGIEFVKCNSIEQLVYKASLENPLVYYIDPIYQDPTIAVFMIKNKNRYGKIILGEYDIQSEKFAPTTSPERYLTSEKYAAENADGIVWRYYARDYLETECNYKYKGKSIHMLDYYIEYGNLLDEPEDDGVLKICFTTPLTSNFLSEKSDNNKYVHEASLNEMMKLFGNRKDCRLDAYLWEANEEERKILDEAVKKYKNFNYYVHIEHSELIHLMSKYDYGIWVYKETTSLTFSDKVRHPYPTQEMITYSVGNKLFDYLSAGIPIVAKYPVEQCRYLKEFGVIAEMNLNDLNIDELKARKHIYRENVKKAHNELLIDNQIHKLIDFFEEVGTGE